MRKDKGMTLQLFKFWIYDRQDEYPEQIHVLHYSEEMARQCLRKQFSSKWWRVDKIETLKIEPRVII